MSDCNTTSSPCIADELRAEIDRLRARVSAWQPIERRLVRAALRPDEAQVRRHKRRRFVQALATC